MSETDPTPPGGELPPMTHREASWHGHRAAMQAEAEPAAGPDEAIALGRAALGEGSQVCGIDFPELTAGSLLAIEAVHRRATVQPMQAGDQLAALVYCLARPQAAFATAEEDAPEAWTRLMRAARALVAPVPLARLPELEAWCVAAIQQSTGSPAPAPAAEKKSGEPTR